MCTTASPLPVLISSRRRREFAAYDLP
jgi:hypothetical protein